MTIGGLKALAEAAGATAPAAAPLPAASTPAEEVKESSPQAAVKSASLKAGKEEKPSEPTTPDTPEKVVLLSRCAGHAEYICRVTQALTTVIKNLYFGRDNPSAFMAVAYMLHFKNCVSLELMGICPYTAFECFDL